MKNQESTQITQARQRQQSKIAVADLGEVTLISVPRSHVDSQPQRRKRRINYMKKIMNDPFILNA